MGYIFVWNIILDLGCAHFHLGEFAIECAVDAVHTVFLRFDVLTLHIHRLL